MERSRLRTKMQYAQGRMFFNKWERQRKRYYGSTKK